VTTARAESNRLYMRSKRTDAGFCERERIERRSERRSPETWARVVLRNIRYRAKKQGLRCTLVPADLVLPDRCPVLDIPLVVGGKRCDNSPSVDRVDNDKGYTKENVRVISVRANRIKHNATVAELKAVAAYAEKETSRLLQ
jgi:hypothetical protein